MTEARPEPLRIALLTYSTRPRGGVVHTLALAEALAAAGQSVTVWSLGRGGDAGFFRPIAAPVAVRLLPFADCDGESVSDRIVRSIEVLATGFGPMAASYDVVHAQDCISANAAPGGLRTIHHLDSFTTPVLVECHERAITRPRGHVCVSRAVADEVHRGWGISATVIPNGVDSQRFSLAAGPDHDARTARQAWRSRFGRYVLAIGGIEPRKGTIDLIEAMAAVRSTQSNLRLVIGGGETLFDYRDYRAAVLSRAAELGLELELLGPVPDADLPALVAAAAVFAFPSVKEGFGIAAMEALAAKVPVVVRDLPVLREVFGSAVRYSTDPTSLAEQILAAAGGGDDSVAGGELAASYTWEAAARSHLEFYVDHLKRAQR